MNQYKAIFSDIDGTVLTSKHEVTPDTRAAILKLEEKGIPFVLVSARMPEAVETVRRLIGNHAPIISYSGALIQDAQGEILYSCHMNFEIAVEVKQRLAEEFPKLGCSTYEGSRWIVDDIHNLWAVKEAAITQLTPKAGQVKDIFKDINGIHKFLLAGEPEEILRAEQFLKKYYPLLAIARSNPNYLEVMDVKAKKVEGVKHLCKHFGIELDEVLVFGDGHNDINMLEAVKNSYAMGNAPQEVKDRAAYVTLDNDHEGVLAVLRENIEY